LFEVDVHMSLHVKNSVQFGTGLPSAQGPV
jgi:hypothetical protein